MHEGDPTAGLATIEHRHFVDCYVDVTGKSLAHSSFDGCVIERRQHPPSFVSECTFQDSRLIGDGWPAWLWRGDKRTRF